jgi:hypothetical protein
VNPHLDSYLRMLAGPGDDRAGRWIDVRWPLPNPRADGNGTASKRKMGQHFYAATDPQAAAAFIAVLAPVADVYIGVALRDRKAGDGASVTRSHLLWADIDHRDAAERLGGFAHQPTMTVASGSAGRLHAYWLLDTVAPIDDVMLANRKLAGALGGDLMMGQSRVSMLRPPATFNHKHTPPAEVQIVELAGSRRYRIEQLVDGLEDPKPPRPRVTTPPAEATVRFLSEHPTVKEADNALRSMDARVWVPRLTGQELVDDQWMCCPFHEERTPSFKAGPGGRYHCFGCGEDGTIFDFAAHVWKRSTSGTEFVYLRADLARLFFGIELPVPERRTPTVAV